MAVVLVNACAGVITAVASRPEPVAPAPVADQITPRQLQRLLGRALATAPDTPEGDRLAHTLTEVIEGDTIIVPPAPPTSSSTTTTTTTTVPPLVTVPLRVTGEDWLP